jgi:ferredoxin
MVLFFSLNSFLAQADRNTEIRSPATAGPEPRADNDPDIHKKALGRLHEHLNPALRQKEDPMKATVTSQCMGDRNCNRLCPEVFAYDEDELLSKVKFDVIPEKYEALVRQAAEECGANAIEIED